MSQVATFHKPYGVACTVHIPIPKRASSGDYAVGADWIPAAGDVKISKDGGVAANIGTLPTALTMGQVALWVFTFTAAEMQAEQVTVTVGDTAAKAVEDTAFVIQTHPGRIAITVDTGSFTATTTQTQSSTSGLSSTNDQYSGRLLAGKTGANAGSFANITAYDGTNKRFTHSAFPTAPSHGDAFDIV